MPKISITSDITLTVDPAPADAFTIEEVAGVSVVCALADGEKCGRCYNFCQTWAPTLHLPICVGAVWIDQIHPGNGRLI